MKTDLTELVFILDRSGSMSGLESDTIGGFNAMLEKQKKESGEVIVTTVLFDDQYDLLHDRINIKGVSNMTDKDYMVRGSTALLDAIGKSINKIGNVQKATSEELRAGKVIFIITTDGQENASKEYSYQKIREMISHEKEKYSWEFIFIGANIDAIATAKEFGIDEDRAANYVADGAATQINYESINYFVSESRANRSVDSSWKDRIDSDYKKRKK